MIFKLLDESFIFSPLTEVPIRVFRNNVFPEILKIGQAGKTSRVKPNLLFFRRFKKFPFIILGYGRRHSTGKGEPVPVIWKGCVKADRQTL